MKKDGQLYLNLGVDASKQPRRTITNVQANGDQQQDIDLSDELLTPGGVNNALLQAAVREESSLVTEEKPHLITVQNVDMEGVTSNDRDGGQPKSSHRSLNFQPAGSAPSESEEMISIHYNSLRKGPLAAGEYMKKRALSSSKYQANSKDSKGGEAASSSTKKQKNLNTHVIPPTMMQ